MNKESSILLDGKGYKFVRDGNKVAFDFWELAHSEIAAENGLGLLTGNNFCKYLLDDGGLIDRDLDGKIHIWNTTSTCLLRGDPQIARLKTLELIETIIGERIIPGI